MNQVKYGFARWLNEFHQYFAPTTAATKEWASRPLERAIVLAPSRMIDQIEEMMGQWRRTDVSGEYGVRSELPVVITALAKDYVPIGGDFSMQVAREIYTMLPDDPKERVFKVRQIQGERRAQLVFIAAEEASARSMAMQFCQWISDIEWRRFAVPYVFAGFQQDWPVMLESTDVMVQAADFGQKNLTGCYVDITLKETIPIFIAPKAGEPNDGKGTDGDESDPHGFPYVHQVLVSNH